MSDGIGSDGTQKELVFLTDICHPDSIKSQERLSRGTCQKHSEWISNQKT